MRLRLLVGLMSILCLDFPAHAQADATAAQLPTDAEIAAHVDRRMAERPGQAMVVGLVGPDGRRVVARGMAGDAPADGRTLFEIGSLTKVFNALLLAEMASRGEVRLDQPARELMPQGTRLPMRGREITLTDLATHRFGLPRLPANLPVTDLRDPYAEYTESMMYAALASQELAGDVGSTADYSNLGAGLLGHLLSNRARTSYADLIRTRITVPLGMPRTRFDGVTAEVPAGMAPPHDGAMAPMGRWRFAALGAAGAMVSNAEDLLTFLEANLQLKPSDLIGAIAATHRRYGDGALPGTGAGLGWFILPGPAGPLLLHNGMTGGYAATMAIDPVRRNGVVVLVNASAPQIGEDVQMLALGALLGRLGPPSANAAVATPPAAHRTEQ